MNGPALAATRPAAFTTLLALKRRLVRNRLNQLLDESPLRVLASVTFIVIIWAALYMLFSEVFSFLRRDPSSAAVAVPYVFHIFFVAMLVLLAFSTAVLCYAALFAREEPAFLLAGPTPTYHIVTIAYLESLFFASWAMILLGLPLMAAIGRVQELPLWFYAIFLASFLSFVPIPGACGLLAAWAVAMWMPRSARRVLGWSITFVLLGSLVWWGRLWNPAEGTEGNVWLDRFMSQVTILRSALLPSTWVSRSIQNAMQSHPADAAYYLYVTAAHGLFLSWLGIVVVGRYLQPAFGRAQSHASRPVGGAGRMVEALTHVLFFYLPRRMRVLVLKDLRAFLRDPAQWSQLAILYGLLSLYLLYLPKYQAFEFDPRMKALICFLNYGAVSLIISTFTSRFVFPMVSMEGRQIWLLGLWPMSRGSILWAKFQFALVVTGAAAMSVTALSIQALALPLRDGMSLLVSTLSVCVGLCGMAIGLGARLPNYNERSAARVAGGLGGTVNLIASMCFVLASLGLMGGMCVRMYITLDGETIHRVGGVDPVTLVLLALQVLLGFGVGWLSMRMGIRHFARAEF